MYKGNLIIIGSPGSGKGTLSEQLKETYDYEVITTGDILRKEKNTNSEIGKRVKELIGKGNLVPDDVMNQIIENKLSTIENTYILDGYPRTIEQGKFLKTISDIELVLYLEVSDETIKERLLERGKTSGREDDQDIKIIERRIKQFKSETLPLVDFYEGKIVSLDGEQNIEQVFKQAQNILKLWK